MDGACHQCKTSGFVFGSVSPSGPPPAPKTKSKVNLSPADPVQYEGTVDHTAMKQLRFALRALFHAPFVTIIAILSLALGIGANTAIFSLFNQLLLQPLPVSDPARLVNLGAPGPKDGSTSCNQAGDCEAVFSYLMFRDLEREQKVFTGIAAHRTFGVNIGYEGQTLTGEGMLVSGSYFQVLGLTPARGRLIDGSQGSRAFRP